VKRIAIVLVGAVLVAACSEDITGSGVIVSEPRDVAAFDRIEAEAGIIVAITVDAAAQPSVTVNYDDNVVDAVVTSVSGGTLQVRLDAAVGFPRGEDRSVDVVLPALTALDASGGSVVSAAGLTGSLILDASGGAVVTISGAGDELALDASGGAIVTADGFDARSADVDLSGGSLVTLRSSESVDGAASGGAQLTIIGDPATIDVDTSGGAQVSP
jgi:hypothetical protein